MEAGGAICSWPAIASSRPEDIVRTPVKETATTTGLHHVPPFVEQNRVGGSRHGLLGLLSQQRVQVSGQPALLSRGSLRVISLGLVKAAGRGSEGQSCGHLREKPYRLVLVAPAGSPALCPWGQRWSLVRWSRLPLPDRHAGRAGPKAGWTRVQDESST